LKEEYKEKYMKNPKKTADLEYGLDDAN